MRAPDEPSRAGDPPANEGQGLGGRSLVGGLWSTGSQVAPYAYTIIVSIVAARILGPGPLGRQSFIAFVVLVVTTVCAAGMPLALMRAYGEALGRGSPGSIPGLTRWGYRVASVATVVGTSGLLAVAALGATPQAAWVFGAVAVAAGILHKVPASILIGTQHWRENSVITVVCGGIGTAITVLVLELGAGITGMLAVAAGVALTMLVWSVPLTRRVVGSLGSDETAELGDLRRAASRFALATSVAVILSFIIAQRSELFFLNHYSPDEEIAFYTIAFSAVTMLNTVPMGMASVILPTFARFFGAGQAERIRASYSRALRLLTLLTIPITLGGLVLGPPLIALVYGDEFAPAGTAFRILILTVPLAPIAAVSGALLAAYRRMRLPIVVSAVGAAADIGAAALLVPHLDSAGAALANDIAAIAGTSIQFVYCVRFLGGVDLAPWRLLRLLIASAAAAAGAQAVLEIGSGLVPLLLAGFVWIVALALLVSQLRVLSVTDADWLTSAVRGTRARRFAGVFSLLGGRSAPAAP